MTVEKMLYQLALLEQPIRLDYVPGKATWTIYLQSQPGIVTQISGHVLKEVVRELHGAVHAD